MSGMLKFLPETECDFVLGAQKSALWQSAGLTEGSAPGRDPSTPLRAVPPLPVPGRNGP